MTLSVQKNVRMLTDLAGSKSAGRRGDHLETTVCSNGRMRKANMSEMGRRNVHSGLGRGNFPGTGRDNFGRVSIGQQKLQQRLRLVQLVSAMAQARQHDDLGRAAEFAVAAGQLRRVGAHRHQLILVAVNVQNLDAGLCQRSKVVDGVEFG